MGNAANSGFDPQAFLVKVGAGKTILKFERSQHVLKQGDAAGAVFYISSLSYPSKIRKQSSGFWNRASSSVRGASMAIRCVSRPQRRWKNA